MHALCIHVGHVRSFFFGSAGLYALQISNYSNNSRDELVSNPGVLDQQRISPPLGLSLVLMRLTKFEDNV